MSGQEDPYSRIYWSVRSDEKFDHVYSCDTCWAAYSRLLMDAEGSYPSPAAIPRSLKRHARDTLAEAKIIELLPHDLFVVHGLQAERERRSAEAKRAVEARWNRIYGTPDEIRPNNGRNTPVLLAEPSPTTPSQTEPSPAEEGAETGAEAYYRVTTRYPQRGTALWKWAMDLGREFGVERFRCALACEMRRDPALKTIMSRTRDALSMAADHVEAEAERCRLAEARKPIILAPVEPVHELTPEEVEAQVANWRASHG